MKKTFALKAQGVTFVPTKSKTGVPRLAVETAASLSTETKPLTPIQAAKLSDWLNEWIDSTVDSE